MQKLGASQRVPGMPLGEDPTPMYNIFIRSTLGKGESGNYADHLQGLAALKAYDEKQSEVVLRQLSRLLQYGHVTFGAVQLALQVLQTDVGRDDKALMRIVQHLVLLGLGDGAAGTPLPMPLNAGATFLAKAVDRMGLEVLVAAWNDLGNERAAIVRKQAALRALAAVTRASLTIKPDDGTFVQGLYVTLKTLLEKVDALRAQRRGLAAILNQAQAGNRKKNLMADVRQRAEMWSLLRGAFAAARLALTRSGLYKVAHHSLSALGSFDPVCARHALSLASLLARDPSGCGSFIAAVEPLLRYNLEAAKRTGALHLGILPSKRGGGSAADAAAPPDSESHLNLRDTWARVYLARSCAAIIQSSHIAGDVVDRGAVFWQALLLLAVSDPSERVALEAIRAMFGAPYPRGTTAGAMRAPGAGVRLLVASSPAEMEAEAALSKVLGASWHMAMSQALAQAPVPEPGAGVAAEGAPVGLRAEDTAVFGRVARRLMRCLQSRSRSLVCAAARAVAVLAEARAWFHALSGGHGHEAEPEVVRRWMRALQGFLLLLAGDETVSGCERAAALEALIWCQGIDQPPTLSPGLMLRAASHGGFTAPPIARYTFADPWPDCLLAEVLAVLARRLRCVPGMPPELVLELAGALAAGSPVGMPREALWALWDQAPGPLAARAALQLLAAPLPPLCQPPAAAAVEVKFLAAQAESAFHSLKAMAACWLGEHVNTIAGEYAWKPWEAKLGPAAAAAAQETAPPAEPQPQAGTADGHWGGGVTAAGVPTARSAASMATAAARVGAGAAEGAAGGGTGGGGGGPEAMVARMAEAAVSHSPLLAMTMAHLNRAVLTGAPVLRVAAAQAVAKVAVRSGEPYRIQCYSLLAAAAGRVGGVAGADPLGLGPVVAPALEVLDAMYAGELVLERHVGQFGARARGWPAAALESLRRRHEWLLGAIGCAVCAVPREVFLPLGPRSRRLLFPDDKEDAEEDARNAAAAEAAQQEEYGNQQYYDDYGQPYQYDYGAAEQYDYGDYYNNASQLQAEQGDPYGQQQDPLARYDFAGQKAAAAVELNWGPEQSGAYDGVDDAAAVAEARPGVVLYSFRAESEGEVSVTAGESVRIVHDLGDWFQVLTAGGQQGLIPASYVQVVDDQQGTDGGAAAGGRSLTLQPSLQSAPSIGSSSVISAQPSYGAGQRPSGEGPAASYDYGYGGGAQQGSASSYPYQYDNPEYDGGNNASAYGSYYGNYGTEYGTDQYGVGAYGGIAYGGGMYGDQGGGSAAAAGRSGKKKGFGGFDDLGEVLLEAKNAVAAARQQQQHQQQQQQPTNEAAPDAGMRNSTGATAVAATAAEGSEAPTPAASAVAAVTSPFEASGSYVAAATPPPASSYSYGATAYDTTTPTAAATAGSGGDMWGTAAAAAALQDSTAAATTTAAAATVEAAGEDAASVGGRGVALYDFVAEMPEELSVAAGEEVEIVGDEVDGWCSARVPSDPTRAGLIPASYLQMRQ